MATDRRGFLQTAGAAIAASGLVLLGKPQLVAASDDEVSRFAVKADDLQPDAEALMVRGQPAALAQVRAELLSSDINFNGVHTSWNNYGLKVDDAMLGGMFESDYPVELQITGVVPAKDVAAFIAAIQRNKGTMEIPSKRTYMVLMKEWSHA
jgi:hypothetical protein